MFQPPVDEADCFGADLFEGHRHRRQGLCFAETRGQNAIEAGDAQIFGHAQSMLLCRPDGEFGHMKSL